MLERCRRLDGHGEDDPAENNEDFAEVNSIIQDVQEAKGGAWWSEAHFDGFELEDDDESPNDGLYDLLAFFENLDSSFSVVAVDEDGDEGGVGGADLEIELVGVVDDEDDE